MYDKLVIVLVLGVMLLVSVVQAVQLNNMLSEVSTLKASINSIDLGSTAQAVAAPSQPSSSGSAMVGGC